MDSQRVKCLLQERPRQDSRRIKMTETHTTAKSKSSEKQQQKNCVPLVDVSLTGLKGSLLGQGTVNDQKRTVSSAKHCGLH